MGSAFAVEDQLKAACTVHDYDAAHILGVYHLGKHNGVPDRRWFLKNFTFTSGQLLGYVREKGVARLLLDSSYDQRGFPSAYMTEKDGCYEVGWFDGKRTAQRSFDDIDEAAADFVLAFWGLGRLPLP